MTILENQTTEPVSAGVPATNGVQQKEVPVGTGENLSLPQMPTLQPIPGLAEMTEFFHEQRKSAKKDRQKPEKCHGDDD